MRRSGELQAWMNGIAVSVLKSVYNWLQKMIPDDS
jgi:hypothetical protein